MRLLAPALGLVLVLLAACSHPPLGSYLYPGGGPTDGVTAVEGPGPLGGLEVAGYLPAYKIPSVDLSQTRHLTDLVYFTMTPRSDGDLYRETLLPEHLNFLLNVKKTYGTRILLGVTDHHANGALATIAREARLRERFAAVLTAFLVDKGLDGADFDWEYPRADDLDKFAALLTAVRASFDREGLRLSVALSPSHPLSRAGYEAVGRVHGMLYDDWGRHSTFENTALHVQEFLIQGVRPAQLLLGVPFYGRGYTDQGPGWSRALSYKSLKERYAVTPSQDTVNGYYFNGGDTVRRKVKFAKAAGLAGVMVWEIGQDTSDGSSLLSVITEARRTLVKPN